MLIQYLNAIDSGFEEEVQQLLDDLTNALDLTTASAETRNRSSKLYGMLASLCRNRSLNIIRSVKNADDYEALRQLAGASSIDAWTWFGSHGNSYKLASVFHESTFAAAVVETRRCLGGGKTSWNNYPRSTSTGNTFEMCQWSASNAFESGISRYNFFQRFA